MGPKTIEQTYLKKTQLEHILLRPDTYIGSIEKLTQPMWVWDSEKSKIVLRPVTYVPGLYKIFDEIVVNAADNKQRDPKMNRIEVTIDPEEGSIRVWNNGSGIPVVVHQEHKIYVPELIFGNLLTGSNFDDNESKTTGGRNGYGAKLANIFSTRFIVETADSERGLKYRQEFSNNMTTTGKPKLTSHKGTDYTCITFYPDLARFNMESLDSDITSLFCKRAYDLAGTCLGGGSKLNVVLNGSKIEARKFEDYLSLYEGIEAPIAYERVNDRWEVGVAVSDGSFQQVSFANSICTSKGGCHVNYIADQITSRLVGFIKKKNKGEELKPNQIKNHIAVFVNALVVNPAFDSQTKENLTTKPSAFGSTCTLSEKTLKAVEKSDIIENILNWAKFKQNADLKKKSGTKRSKLSGIPKLDDANFAGTNKSSQCTLILTEGDSAKALAISGLGVVGRDLYGVFPLRGKLLNVREASHAQIMKNEEIQNITKILGLTFGKEYTDIASLRYGHLMIMTDQDHDGSHIKGLLINFLHYFWPSLLRIPGFLQQFITPIVKCKKGQRTLSFYTIPEYQEWKMATDEGRGWSIKYYKGLGTSTSAEAKEYFSNLDTHELNFDWDEGANDCIDMAFAKKRVEDRKLWLLSMRTGTHIDYKQSITYDKFVNEELILFSHADNTRSIAHFMDGFKPSQRKVLFSCFKRNLRQEIKVGQLVGYVSEHSAYHHGDASLSQTIIGMAQNFVGSNNINLLSPCGQFGTRLMGGKDAASARYVFTKLEKVTRCIFHPDDDGLLEYLEDDGQSIEPEYYVPIIPMALVNGSEGIGTGWSSSIPTYNPREIITNLRRMIQGEEPEHLAPWYRGFTGTVVEKAGTANFIVSGTIEQIDETTVRITELPVGKWTTDYKQFLESVVIGGPGATGAKDKEEGTSSVTPFIKDFRENHTDTTVLFTVTLPAERLAEIVASAGGLMRKFKLDTSVSTTNMHMFDLNHHIKRFDGPTAVLRDFYHVRMQYYDRRKIHLIDRLTHENMVLDNKVRFILAVIAGELVVSNRPKKAIFADLRAANYDMVFPQNSDGDNDMDDLIENEAKGYDYLLSLKIWSLTLERVQELRAERDNKMLELEELKRTTPEKLWSRDLDNLEEALNEFDAQFDATYSALINAQKKAKSAAKAKATKAARKRAADVYDDEDFDEVFEDIKPVAKKAKPVSKFAPITIPVAPVPAPVPTVTPVIMTPTETIVIDKSSSPKIPTDTISISTAKSTSKPATKSMAKPAAKSKSTPAKRRSVLDSDSESEAESEVALLSEDFSQNSYSSRPRRAAATSISRELFIESDDEDMESDDEDMESDEDSISEQITKKKTVAKKSAPAKAARVPTKKTATIVNTPPSPNKIDVVEADVPQSLAKVHETPVKNLFNFCDDDAVVDLVDVTSTPLMERLKKRLSLGSSSVPPPKDPTPLLPSTTKSITKTAKPKETKPKETKPKKKVNTTTKRKSFKDFDSDDDDDDDVSISDDDSDWSPDA